MSSIDRADIWFAVVNSFAASKKATAMWKSAEKLLKEREVTFHGVRTGSAGNAAELSFDACMAGYRRFIAVGGDGTVHDVLNGIAVFIDWSTDYGHKVTFADFTLGVIPLGSGNDWIKSLGIRCSITDAVDVIKQENIARQDVVRVSLLDPSALPHERPFSVSYMANVGGVGLDARVCELVNAKKKQGKSGKILYATSLIQALAKRKSSKVKLFCDGREVFDGEYISMSFGIGKYSGGGMRQTPDAVLDDGLLDVSLIPELPFHRILVEAPKLFTGKLNTVPELVTSKGKSMTVIPYEGNIEAAEVDGEVIGKAPIRLDVLPQQLNILLPAKR